MSGLIININNISNKVRNTVLTGLNTALTGTISATDTVLQAFGKLQNQINSIPPNTAYGLFAQTANSTPITGTNVETSLINGGVGTLSVPANGFAVGDSFTTILGGILTAANNQTIRIKVKSGSVILLDSGVQNISNITNDVFSLNLNFTIRQIGGTGTASIVSLGTFHYVKTSNATTQGFAFNVVNNTTFNTTIANTLDITVQWGSNNAGNTIYSDIFVLNKIY